MSRNDEAEDPPADDSGDDSGDASGDASGDDTPEGTRRSTQHKLQELERRRRRARQFPDPEAVARQHDQGKLTARARLDKLLDEGSFTETDALATSRITPPDLDEPVPGDTVITGHGTVNGRPVCVYSQDATVLGGSLGELATDKVCRTLERATTMGVPLVGLSDASGPRIEEGVLTLAGFGEMFRRSVDSSGVVPQISAVMGPCAGGAAYVPALGDFTFMVRDTAHMFVTGPNVIKRVTGEQVNFEQLGGAMTHAATSGVAHFASDSDEACLRDIRRLLSFLPSNNLEQPPRRDGGGRQQGLEELNRIVPDRPDASYDMREVIRRVVDDGELLEVHAHFAENLIVGLARLDGRPVGVVANQPRFLAGVLDINACVKAARFVRTCDAFNLPLVSFVDVPGFLPGVEQEYGGLVRHGAKLAYAYAEATVPVVTVITRKAYGAAYSTMASKHLGADVNLAWPTAEIAVMSAEGAVGVLHRDELARAEDPEALHEELERRYREQVATPWKAAERGYVDAVIEPAETRIELVRALELTSTKRRGGPARKHGNPPL